MLARLPNTGPFKPALRHRRLQQPRSATLQAPAQPDLGRQLLQAREQAVRLFDEIERRGTFAAGRTEDDCNTEIFQLAEREFGTRKHWHARIVRAGGNTVHTYAAKGLPNVVLGEDDLAFVDLGPVFSNIEADFARSYVIGEDEEKHKLSAALPVVFNTCREHYLSRPEMTGEELYDFVCKECERHGYTYGNWFCAHLIGAFAHETNFPHDEADYAQAGNKKPMNARADNKLERFWVLEIHLLHKAGKFGGFYEDLLMPGY